MGGRAQQTALLRWRRAVTATRRPTLAGGGRHDDDALLPLIFQHVLDLPYRALDVPHGRRVPRRRPRRGQQHVPRQGAVAGGAPLQRQERTGPDGSGAGVGSVGSERAAARRGAGRGEKEGPMKRYAANKMPRPRQKTPNSTIPLDPTGFVCVAADPGWFALNRPCL